MPLKRMRMKSVEMYSIMDKNHSNIYDLIVYKTKLDKPNYLRQDMPELETYIV